MGETNFPQQDPAHVQLGLNCMNSLHNVRDFGGAFLANPTYQRLEALSGHIQNAEGYLSALPHALQKPICANLEEFYYSLEAVLNYDDIALIMTSENLLTSLVNSTSWLECKLVQQR